MAIVTGATIKLDDGTKLEAHASGSSFAILCPNCKKHPILFIAQRLQEGTERDNPAICDGCGKSYYIISNINPSFLREIIIKAV